MASVWKIGDIPQNCKQFQESNLRFQPVSKLQLFKSFALWEDEFDLVPLINKCFALLNAYDVTCLRSFLNRTYLAIFGA